MMQVKKKDWFNPKGYVHIDRHLSYAERYSILTKLRNTQFIAKYAFKPLIHRVHTVPKYIKGQTSSNKRRTRKKRHICFAAHFDSQIYSYYSKILSRKYEKWLEKNNLSGVAIAYRSIKAEGEGDRHKCHIDFAKEAFDYIKKMVHEKSLLVVVADISGFFDSLDHHILKQKWSQLLGMTALPTDHYNIYKNVTRFSYVEEYELFELFKDSILTQISPDSEIRPRNVSRLQFLRDRHAVSFCETKSGIKLIRDKGLIRTGAFNIASRNNSTYKCGIPQGLPISSTLANIYMSDFDKAINDIVSTINGVYMRYSDDIIIIAQEVYKNEIVNLLKMEIEKVNLVIKDEKTRFLTFDNKDGRCYCRDNKKLEYLGLCFDGEMTTLKNRSVSQYYWRMRKAARRHLWYAKHINNSSRSTFFLNQFLRRFSKLGASPYPSRKTDRRGKTYTVKRYGNYLGYVARAASITGSSSITKQLSRNLSRLNALISIIEKELKTVNK